MIHAIIFWGAYAYFPFMVIALWGARRANSFVRGLLVLSMLATSCLAYARFIEPRILVTHEETILLPGASSHSPSIRIALFGDPHLGRFGNAMPLERIVKRINREDVDAVLLAGDLTYHPDVDKIPTLLAPLNDLNAPLFTVFGNHDVGIPGPDLTNPLLKAFSTMDAQLAHNRSFEIELNGQKIIIGGTSDLWQRQMSFDFAGDFSSEQTVLLLTHNPDMAAHIPSGLEYDLLLAGHTHGGQIRLPVLYKHAIPTEYPFDKELHTFPAPDGDKLVYVTSGTGMVGLPMRFAMPPRVDILTIHIPETEKPANE